MRYFLLLFCLFTFQAYAVAPKAPLLTFLPQKSRVTFSAIQNHVPVEGRFTQFNLVIHFAENNLEGSSVKAEIDLGSVQTDYDEVADNLKGEEWFNVKSFPQAIFESQHFTHKEGNHYEAVGTLTLHGHNIPVTLPFTLTTEADGALRIEGETTLKRANFGVGQGEWASSSVVADEVTVKVVAEAVTPASAP
jgi:polyisoprenoid-binding protein YceI